MAYHAYPQKPESSATPLKQPDHISLVNSAEAIIIGARQQRDRALRETCQEYLGYDVPRARALPRGDVAECTMCYEVKSLRDFSPDERKVNGRQSYCKACDCKRKKREQLRQALATV